MRVLHVTAMDPKKVYGGVANAARNLSEGYELKFYNASGLSGLAKAFLLAVKLLNEKYDMIHFHDSIPAYFYLKLGGRAKTIYTSHGHWTTFFETLPPKNFFERAKAKLLIHMQNYTISNVDVAVAVSKKIRDVMMKNSKPKRIEVVYNGVDTKIFRPLGLRRRGAIWVGKDPARKRLDKTIEYARKHKMRLVVIGVQKIPPDISGVEINSYNNLTDGELAEKYNEAEVMPFFSEQEGHPLAVLEAMACGCDIVASESTNLEILPLKGGYYKVSGREAARMAGRFDWHKIRRQYSKLYKEVAG